VKQKKPDHHLPGPRRFRGGLQTIGAAIDFRANRKVTHETKEAAQDMKDYTFAQQAEFVTQMQSQLDALDKDMDPISAKIESFSDAFKADAKPILQALRDQAAQLNKQLDNIRNATESTWESVQVASRKAFDSLQDGFQQSRQWLSDKIAP
jgi:methyl-accepting chemotaxis protein